ncbi:hypothetical protein ACO0OL_003603 [Hanseniaspora opuntiae]
MGNNTFKGGRKELRHNIKKIGERKQYNKKQKISNNEFVEKIIEQVSDDSEEDDSESEDEFKTKDKVYNSLLKLIKNEDDIEEDEDDIEDDLYFTKKQNFKSEEILNEDEEDVNEDLDANDVDSDDENPNVVDYYKLHFDSYNESSLKKLNESKNQLKFNVSKSPILNNDPAVSNEELTNTMVFMKPKLNFDDNEVTSPEMFHNLHSYQYKQKLKLNNPDLFKKNHQFTNVQKNIIDPINQYSDLLYTYQEFKHEAEYREIYIMHVLNHIFKTRDKILKNNYKLSQQEDADADDDSFKDQGYNRTKCLIVLPTRQNCYDVLSSLIKKSGIEQVDKINKFKDQFNIDDDGSLDKLSMKDDDFKYLFKGNTNDFFILGCKFTRKTLKLYSALDSSDLIMCSPLGLKLLLESYSKPKPEQNEGNEDDDVKKMNEQLGIKSKNKKFHKGSRGKKNTDDFLSSIEIAILDQFQTFEYQNAANIINIMKSNLNNLPKEQTTDMDFGRIKYYYLDNLQYLFRQTLIFTKNLSVNSNLIFNNCCFNKSGKFKNLIRVNDLKQTSLNYLKLYNILKMKFQRFEISKDPSQMIVSEPDYRFKFFISSILPNLIKNEDSGVLIYIPDYTDFLRLKNYISKNTSLLVDDLHEYSSVSKITKTRNYFKMTTERNNGIRGSKKVNVLLYTERLHYYRKYDIKGIKNLIFYKPPSDYKFFQDFLKMLVKYNLSYNKSLNEGNASDSGSDDDDGLMMEDLIVRCIYSKLDSLYMNRLVGNKNLGVLMSGSNDVYEFK